MKQKYPHLCEPITVGRVTFRNRMFSFPMGGTDITADGCIGPRSLLRESPIMFPAEDYHLKEDSIGDTCTGDSILCGLGLKPNTAVAEELRGSAPQFFAIGNCVRPDTITNAVYQGYHAALDI